MPAFLSVGPNAGSRTPEQSWYGACCFAPRHRNAVQTIRRSLFMHTRKASLPAIPAFALKLLIAGVLMVAAFILAPLAQAAEPAQGGGDQPVVQRLLDAMAQNDYQAFTSQGTPEFAAIDQAQFSQVSTSLAPRLKQGYTVQYMGNLQQQGLDISVWKISFQDQGDDLLATLNVQDGRVGGFFLR